MVSVALLFFALVVEWCGWAKGNLKIKGAKTLNALQKTHHEASRQSS